MACKTLARLYNQQEQSNSSSSSSSSSCSTITTTPPLVQTVIPLCKIGKNDDTGEKLLKLLEQTTTSTTTNVDIKYIQNGQLRDLDDNSRTALAVLPIYLDGRRGCFFDAASNNTFNEGDLEQMLNDVRVGVGGGVGAFIFGYPHLLPCLQGEALGRIYTKVKEQFFSDNGGGGVTVLDLNGVPQSAYSSTNLRTVQDLLNDKVLGGNNILNNVDILHMNEEELMYLTGYKITHQEDENSTTTATTASLSNAASIFIQAGVAVVAITRGKKGCFIKCSHDETKFQNSSSSSSSVSSSTTTSMLPKSWCNCEVIIPAITFDITTTQINTNGAGDAFTCGLLIASLLRRRKCCTKEGEEEEQEEQSFDLKSAANFATKIASMHVNVQTRDLKQVNIHEILQSSSSS